MLKVMIVEDEDIVREDIKHLINWESHGFTIAAEARNGGEGLRYFQDHNPDIIITDIKMPVMSGLDMIGHIMKLQKHAKIILLTAYGDFDFAREALKLGIHSYVLKHELDSPLLLEELNKVRRRMEAEESVEYLARKEKLRMLLKRAETHPDPLHPPIPEQLFRWKGRTGICILGIEPSAGDPDEQPHPSRSMDKKEMIDFLYSRPFLDFEADAVDMNPNEYLIFYRIPERSSERAIFEYGTAFMNHLLRTISEAFPVVLLSIAAGPVFESYRDLRGSVKKCKELFAQRVFQKGSAILTDSQASEDKEMLLAAVAQLLERIQQQLQHDEYAALHSSLDELFTRQLAALRDPAALRSSIFELIRLINLKGLPRQGTPMMDALDAWTEVQQLGNVYQMAEWFQRMLKQLEEESSLKYSKKIRELLQYIHANYQKELSLNEIADRLGFSLIYTSQLFKKEVGVSFVTYLTQYRIGKAKELLETGKYKVYEVSSMVGYQTVQYFCKTFKKVTGQNPGDL